MIRVYVARAMSGRIKEEVVMEAKKDKEFLEKAGFTVLCPVSEENVQPTNQVLMASKKDMDRYWFRDKEMIRDAHILFNMSPDKPSLGVIREHGYARYFLWKPVISVFPAGELPMKAAICHYEDDYVTDDIMDAVGEAHRRYGTPWKRLKWKIALLSRCLSNFIRVRVVWFFDWL